VCVCICEPTINLPHQLCVHKREREKERERERETETETEKQTQTQTQTDTDTDIDIDIDKHTYTHTSNILLCTHCPISICCESFVRMCMSFACVLVICACAY